MVRAAQFEELWQKSKGPFVAICATHRQTQQEQLRQIQRLKTEARSSKFR
jgi:hypothetical protein